MTRLAALTAVLAFAVTTAACSDNNANSSATPASQSDRTTAVAQQAAPRPAGPAAEVTGPMIGGKGTFLGAAAPVTPQLDAAGYTQAEYEVQGTASSYRSAGALPADGTYSLEAAASAPYRTRIVVYRPTDPKRFSGTVAVEWLNVSGGVDAAPDFTYLGAELLRSGDAWVGVSAQRIGVEGGPIAVKAPGAEAAGAGKGLKGIDPARYGALSHPGDAFSYDIYTQVARSLLQHGPADPLAGLEPTQLIAVGESQSAFALTTYYDGVQPLTKAFDGFFIHSRGGAALPIDAPSGYSDIASSISGQPTKLRTDLDAPVITIETESDVLGVIGFLPARQPDSDHLRIWEVAGAAHADSVQLGASESALGCATPINRGQQVFVLRAAFHHLRRWAAGGDPPPKAEPLQVIDGGPSAKSFALDPNGNVLGGVRTPSVDAPTSVLSGLAPAGASVICMLMGSTTPLTADRLANLYTSRKDYEDWYSAATSDAIDRGFILAADREAVLADAHPDAIAP